MAGELLMVHRPAADGAVMTVARSVAGRAGWGCARYSLEKTLGDPGVEIGRRTADKGLRLVVAPVDIGESARSGILRRSRTPVLWLPADAEPPDLVRVALDGRRWSRFVLDAAVQVAEAIGASLSAVIILPTEDDPRIAEVLRLLHDTVDYAVPLDVVTGSDPGDDLVADSRRTVLTLGVHRGGTAQAGVGDRTAQRVLARATGPVLTVPL
jgi:hypothetical protein